MAVQLVGLRGELGWFTTDCLPQTHPTRLRFLVEICEAPNASLFHRSSPMPGCRSGFLQGMASRLIYGPAVVVKPVSIGSYKDWLSLAKSHFSNKSIAPTGSGA